MKAQFSSQRSGTFARRARAPLMRLDQPGRLYVAHLMHLFQCSHQTIYSRIRKGVYPQPDGRDGKRPYWLTTTVRPWFESS
jgi:hypothetical protein